MGITFGTVQGNRGYTVREGKGKNETGGLFCYLTVLAINLSAHYTVVMTLMMMSTTMLLLLLLSK